MVVVMTVDRADEAGPAPSAGALFLGFLGVGLAGFGGVLPFARRMLVQQRAWLDERDFNETLALCQSLPGPNIVNMTVVVGRRFAGPAGALAALAGLIVAPVTIVIVLGALYGRFGAMGRIPGAILGLGAAAAGLVAATAAKMARPLLARRPVSGGVVALLAFTAVGIVRLPLPMVMAVMAPLSVILAWTRPR
jgi:chromate transporter